MTWHDMTWHDMMRSVKLLFHFWALFCMLWSVYYSVLVIIYNNCEMITLALYGTVFVIWYYSTFSHFLSLHTQRPLTHSYPNPPLPFPPLLSSCSFLATYGVGSGATSLSTESVMNFAKTAGAFTHSNAEVRDSAKVGNDIVSCFLVGVCLIVYQEKV